MKKISVELYRQNGIDMECRSPSLLYKYGENTELALDEMVKATEKFEDIRVYKHIVTETYENNRFFDWHGRDIPCADHVIRLHVFYEDCFGE